MTRPLYTNGAVGSVLEVKDNMAGVLDELAVGRAGVSAAVPALRWQVLVDWFGAGVWGAAGVDVSDDVVGVGWRWGRCGLPVPEFAPPATVELSLRNLNHRYTPGNTASPLAGQVQPGREVRLRAAWPYDDFATDAGGAQTLDDRVATGGIVSWQVLATAGSGFEAQEGEVRGLVGRGRPSDAVATLDTGDPLATLLVRFRRGSNGLGGFVLRCAARNNCLRLRFTDTATALERVSGRAATELATGDALAESAWYELEVVQSDASVRVFATNLDTRGLARQELVAATGISDAPDSGRHGLWHGFRNTVDRWGDFSVGRTLFCGRINAIEPDYERATCRITAGDVLQRVDGIPLSRNLSGGPMRSGAVAAAILGWAGLEASDYAVDTGRLLLSGGPRAVWEVTAGRALRRLQREENGLLYVDGLGRVRLEAGSVRAAIRNHADPTALAKVAVSGVAGGANPFASSLRWDDGAGAVENQVTFRYQRSADNGRQLVWSLNEPLAVAAGGNRLVLAATDDWDVVTDLATPAADTDYQATDDAAGDGSDVTGDVSVAVLAEADSGVAGRGATLRVSNAGAQTAYLQLLNLYAAHGWRPSGATGYQRAAHPATGEQSPARVVICRYVDHYAAAQDAADARFAERSRRRPQLEVSLPLLGAANLRAALEGRLSEVITAPAGAAGAAGAWFLEGVELQASAGRAGVARWWVSGV